MVKATKVDGVYDKDPHKFLDAQRFDTLHMKKALDIGVNVMDHAAIAMALDNSFPLYVTNIDLIEAIGTDRQYGTVVIAD
jgi:uridylate kinase